MKKVDVYFERSKDGCYYAYAANPMTLPYGLTGGGDSVEQAKTDWLNVYEATRARYEEEGKTFTEAEFIFCDQLNKTEHENNSQKVKRQKTAHLPRMQTRASTIFCLPDTARQRKKRLKISKSALKK